MHDAPKKLQECEASFSCSCLRWHFAQEMETGFDMCAVCIEGYRSCDVIRILPCK